MITSIQSSTRQSLEPVESVMQPDLSQFFDLSMDLLAVLSLEGCFKHLSVSWEKVLGYSRQELLDKTWMDLVYPGDCPTVSVAFQKLQSSPKRSCFFKKRFRRQDGTYRWLQWQAIAPVGQPFIYAVVRDVTDLHKSQQALRDSEERFRYLVDSVKDYAIYMLDPQGRVASWNEGAERINGYREEEILGEPVSRFYPPEDVYAGKPDQELRIAANQGRFEDESCRIRRDGSRFWVHAVVTALRDDKGRLRGFAKVTRDVTERKQNEAALRCAYDELEKRVEERTADLVAANRKLRLEIAERQRIELELRQSQTQLMNQTEQLQQTLSELQRTEAQLVQSEKMSSLGQLVAGVAHEINNPVGFIYGNIGCAMQYFTDLLDLLKLYQETYPETNPAIQQQSEVISLDFLVQDLPKLLNSIKVGAERIQEIVLSLRNFSRVDESGKKPVNIHEGLDNTLLILRNRLQIRSGTATIQVVKEYGDLPLVECYAGQLNQVFMNILSNAIDALEDQIESRMGSLAETTEQSPEPTIWICTEFLGDRYRISIRDNGSGMTEQTRQRLFDPFFTTKPVGKGTGLGLSISYQIIVEKHGGKLHCQSVRGKGTTFTIEIPAPNYHCDRKYQIA